MSFLTFLLKQLEKALKRSNQLSTRFVNLVRKSRGEMSFVIFSLIQL